MLGMRHHPLRVLFPAHVLDGPVLAVAETRCDSDGDRRRYTNHGVLPRRTGRPAVLHLCEIVLNWMCVRKRHLAKYELNASISP